MEAPGFRPAPAFINSHSHSLREASPHDVDERVAVAAERDERNGGGYVGQFDARHDEAPGRKVVHHQGLTLIII